MAGLAFLMVFDGPRCPRGSRRASSSQALAVFSTGPWRADVRSGWPREESNLRTQIRSLPLYPLSYGASGSSMPGRFRTAPSDAGPTLAAMTLGIVVFGAAFLVGLGLGTYTRRPLSTAFLVLGSFTALLVLSATGDISGAGAVLAIVLLLGLIVESVRETLLLLVGR